MKGIYIIKIFKIGKINLDNADIKFKIYENY